MSDRTMNSSIDCKTPITVTTLAYKSPNDISIYCDSSHLNLCTSSAPNPASFAPRLVYFLRLHKRNFASDDFCIFHRFVLSCQIIYFNPHCILVGTWFRTSLRLLRCVRIKPLRVFEVVQTSPANKIAEKRDNQQLIDNLNISINSQFFINKSLIYKNK